MNSFNALVTGGAGFIGSHVTNELIKNGVSVVVVDDLSGGFKENVNPEAIFESGSVTDTDFVNSLFLKYKFDHIYHLAAYAAEGLSHFIRRFNYTNNLIGSVNLINAAVKYNVKCFVFTSSIAVYGKGVLPLTEEQVPVPEDPYGISKLAVEMDLKAAHEMFGLDYIIFRPHNVYGEFQNIGDRYRNVVGIFMNQIMQGKDLSVFGDGLQTRAFSYISDVAPVIANSVNLPEAYNQVFNIGADKEYTVLELAEKVIFAMGAEAKVNFLPKRNEVEHAWADHSKVKKVFGISYLTDLEIGLGKMAAWAKTAGIRKTARFSDIELLKNLPEFWLKD